jgi:Rrf2 family transcriptional regulator, cysteine metabolism repressor
MKLNTKMRYGTRALVALARRYQEGSVSLAEIARLEELSEKYLEALFATLRSAGLVRSQRGAHGGYVLARAPEEVRLREVFDVLEGSEPYVPCTSDPGACPRRDHCATQRVWAKMYDASMQVLESTTLADLAACDTEAGVNAAMYFI